MRLGTYYRSRLLWRLGHGRSSGRFLDIGGFDGYWAASVEGGIAYSLDIDTRPQYPQVRYIRGDGQRLPFRDASFDAVFALDVIEHVPDEGSLLVEALRVLRPDGRLILTTPSVDIRIFPAFLQPWANRRWGHDRVSGFRADRLQSSLESSGAKNVKVLPLAAKAFRCSYLPLSAMWRLPGRAGQLLVEKAADWDARHLVGRKGYLLVEATR
jgi:SAM-dependent methyltransferase